MDKLIHLVYASAATTEVGLDEVKQIIKTSLTNNYASNITGMLLYAEGSFIQLLEGDEQEVESLFMDIRQDPRHTDVVLLYKDPIERRYFGEWSMGLADLPRKELASIPGCRSFMDSGERLAFIPPLTARRMLEGFMHGKWRRHIS